MQQVSDRLFGLAVGSLRVGGSGRSRLGCKVRGVRGTYAQSGQNYGTLVSVSMSVVLKRRLDMTAQLDMVFV